MTLATYRREVRIARPAAEVFTWHERAGALARLTPPWVGAEVVSGPTDGVRDGSRVVLRAGAPWRMTWDVEHHDYVAGVQFRDRARRSPFAHWEHLHRVEPEGAGACRWIDEVRYALPGGALGRLGAGYARRELERLFAWRHAVLQADLETLPRLAPRRVLVTGASGLVGRTLGPLLTTQGHTVIRAVRRERRSADEVSWRGTAGSGEGHDLAAAGPCDVVVHLAGENIAAGRWTTARRRAIRESRGAGTRALVAAIARLPQRPELLVSASAVGFYGDTGDEPRDERSPGGPGFLAEVCAEWEEAAQAAERLGVRVVRLRLGVVMSPAGGALAKLLPLFRLGLGGPVGAGLQWMSWVSPDDLAAMVLHAMARPELHGPVNAVAPEPVRNHEWTHELASLLERPAVLPVPAVLLRMVFGAMGQETVLASQRVQPTALTQSGFHWRHPTLREALAHGLGR